MISERLLMAASFFAIKRMLRAVYFPCNVKDALFTFFEESLL